MIICQRHWVKKPGQSEIFRPKSARTPNRNPYRSTRPWEIHTKTSIIRLDPDAFLLRTACGLGTIVIPTRRFFAPLFILGNHGLDCRRIGYNSVLTSTSSQLSWSYPEGCVHRSACWTPPPFSNQPDIVLDTFSTDIGYAYLHTGSAWYSSAGMRASAWSRAMTPRAS